MINIDITRSIIVTKNKLTDITTARLEVFALIASIKQKKVYK